MKHSIMKIREHFIEPIISGLKIHEYRLATPERRRLSSGDILILVSNTNPNNYVLVQILATTIFKNWEDALDKNWVSDFHGLFNSKEEVLKECKRFYTKSEVDEYGIISYRIQPLIKNYKNSRVLLDTNIFIQRESSNNVSIDVNKMFRWFEKLNIKKYIHQDTVDELKSNYDETIRNTMLAKTNSYVAIEPKTKHDDYFEEIINKYSKNRNDIIDNNLLLQAYNHEVDYLITDDRKMLLKAKDLFINNFVMSTQEFISKIEALYPENIEYDVLSIKKKKFGSYDIENDFFDSLRQDYGGLSFDEWYKKKYDEDIYTFEENGKLMGFLYLKVEDESEDYSNISPCFEKKRRLKVGTFKIVRQGLRLGERFFKIIFDNALKNYVDEVYVTMFENKRNEVIHLMNSMMEFGFEKWGYKSSENGEEIVLVKSMRTYNFEKDAKYNYPLIKQKNINYGFLPIESSYHSNLFPDLHLKNENMSISEKNACSYAIEKIYICKKGDLIKLKNGDLMCIYMISNLDPKKYRSVVTGLAIFEEVIKPKTKDEFLNICKNKTVFSADELEQYYDRGIYRYIVKLLFYKAFDNKILLKDLRELNIVDNASGPQYSTIINEEQFNKINEIGNEV